MSDIQRYIHRPKGMDPDGCGKWCVHAEARNHYHKIIEDKDQEIERLNSLLAYEKQSVENLQYRVKDLKND